MKIRSITTTNFTNNSKNIENRGLKTETPAICHKEYFPNGQIKEEKYTDGTVVGYNEQGDVVFQLKRRNFSK